jgi:hypothetical protein
MKPGELALMPKAHDTQYARYGARPYGEDCTIEQYRYRMPDALGKQGLED